MLNLKLKGVKKKHFSTIRLINTLILLLVSEGTTVKHWLLFSNILKSTEN